MENNIDWLIQDPRSIPRKNATVTYIVVVDD